MAKSTNRNPQGPSQRQLRVGEAVRHALAEVLARGDIHDDVIAKNVLTISEVRMTPDLKTAIVFVAPFGSQDLKPVLKALDANKKFIRGIVARAVNLKYAPDLKFKADDSFSSGQRIDELLASPKVRQDLEN